MTLAYASILLFFSIQQNRIEKDIAKLYLSKEIWNDLQISMNELPINWANGKTYQKFEVKYNNLENLLKQISSNKFDKTPFLNKSLSKRKEDLYSTWSISKESVQNIISIINNSDFQRVIKSVEKMPGLQRINHLQMELFNSNNTGAKKDAYILQQLLEEIEFFPIYSETINHLFNVIIKETDKITIFIGQIRFIISIIFFFLFLLLYMLLSLRFSNSIAKPIIKLSMDLSSFMGKTLKLESYSHTDELKFLTLSVSNLIKHYTYLSGLAERLSLGELTSPIMELKEQGVVGNSLKDINLYLNELAETSQWIKEGNYGAEVRIKSDKDILAKNFNIMSRVISEQITTLRNMFQTVEESIVVIDYEGNIIEANNKFKLLTNSESSVNKSFLNLNIISYLEEKTSINDILNYTDGKEYYINIKEIDGNLIPIKIISRLMPEISGQKRGIMLFITNESLKFRIEREKEELKSHAIEAELRALRAQINPHFLFNTLNAIAHLIESKSDEAVDMIERLSELFRYSLASTRRNTVPLSEELDIIKQYLDIEKMRFGNNLMIEYFIDKNLTRINIPPMLIQPVVENAVKYGVDTKGDINISIEISRINKNLIISISDKGSQVVNHQMLMEHKGTGIKNVNQRLKSLYNNQLSFIQNNPQGLKVVIEIPEDGSRYDTNSNN